MLFEEIVPVYSVDRKKAINALYGQNAELLNVKGVVHTVLFSLLG
jgi:hypothetical protein